LNCVGENGFGVPAFNWPFSSVTGTTWTATNIYLAPTSLSAITFNFLMSLSGGLMAGYLISKGDPYWTFSCGLCGVIATSAGNDLYHPIQAMLIGAIIPAIIYKLHYYVENRFKIDDRNLVVALAANVFWRTNLHIHSLATDAICEAREELHWLFSWPFLSF